MNEIIKLGLLNNLFNDILVNRFLFISIYENFIVSSNIKFTLL